MCDEEKSLWESVLHRAIADYVLYHGHRDRNKRLVGEEARTWLFDDVLPDGIHDKYEIGTFFFICAMLDLDPSAVRSHVHGNERRILHSILRNPGDHTAYRYYNG